MTNNLLYVISNVAAMMRKRTAFLLSLTLSFLLFLLSTGFSYGRPTHQAFVPSEILVKFSGEEKGKLLKLPKSKSVEDAVREFKQREGVEYAEPNYIAEAFLVPNDPYYPYQWHFRNNPSGGIQTEAAWDISRGAGVVVAVIDTGIAYEDYRFRSQRFYQAPDLAQACFVAGYDFVENDNHPGDDNSHGTHVAGTVAQSTNNGLGVAGVAFESCLMPVKVLDRNGSGNYAAVADGIRWAADHGAKVINLSLGGSLPSNYLEEAVAYAYSKGVVIVAAAGNDGASAISYPAAYDNYVIAVGATRLDETRAYYSNYGLSLDLVAPGGDLNVDQNSDGYVDGVLQNTFNPNTKNTSDFGYWFFQGTSMAAPHVAGVAALVIANGNATTPEDVRSVLQNSAKDLGAAGWDETFGWGLVNAAAALGTAPPPPPPNQPPTADAGPDKTAYVGEAVSFDGSGSHDADGTITDYLWDFGDGESGNGVSVSHIYAAVGTYTVTLTVTDDGGLTGSDQAVVMVQETPPQPKMHVGDITFSFDKRGRFISSCRVTATVPVLDGSDTGIGGATVFGSWSGAFSQDVSDSTGADGTVSFHTGWVRGCGTFTFTVNNVTKDGWIYDPAANRETSDTITINSSRTTK